MSSCSIPLDRDDGCSKAMAPDEVGKAEKRDSGDEVQRRSLPALGTAGA